MLSMTARMVTHTYIGAFAIYPPQTPQRSVQVHSFGGLRAGASMSDRITSSGGG